MQHSISGTTRRGALLAAGSVLVAGCLGDDGNGADGDGDDGGNGERDAGGNGDDEVSDTGQSQDDTPPGEVTQMGDLTLTSPAFEDGGRIPDKYGYSAENVNPPLEISDVPDDAQSLALIVDDPDARDPAGKIWDHWVVWNIPPDRRTIPEGWAPVDAVEGTNDYGETGYGGPNPPDSEHRYRFKLYALDTTLDLPVDTNAEALEERMAGHVIAQTQLDGTYPP